MKLLVVGHAPIRASNRDVYRALAARGHDVALVVPRRWQSAWGRLDVEPAGDDGVRIFARPIAGRHHSNLYWFLGGLDRAVRASGAQALYVDEDPAGFAAAQAALTARRHGLGLVVLAVQNILKRYPAPFGTLQHWVLSNAGAAVSNSQQATSTLERRGYRGPVFDKPLTVDAEPLADSERAAVRARYGMRAPAFGYVGRLVAEKGVSVYLEALARVPAANGTIVGDGPQRALLEARARALGLESRVRFFPAVSPAEALSVIGALDALVLPSLTVPNWSEQFGRVLVEAMAQGVPLVASAGGAIPEVVGDAGLLVPEGRADELARALEALLVPATAASFARRGRARAHARYSARTAAESLERAFEYSLHGPTTALRDSQRGS
jgi:glycosyltransferase involved in cell wall biosynthesis